MLKGYGVAKCSSACLRIWAFAVPYYAKKPKMPDQACANGLKLHDIPQELDSITPLECRLVAKCIPFLTILLMKRYGWIITKSMDHV